MNAILCFKVICITFWYVTLAQCKHQGCLKNNKTEKGKKLKTEEHWYVVAVAIKPPHGFDQLWAF